MTTYPQTITFGEMRRIRRARCVDLLPSVFLRQVGVVAVASLARQSPDSTADDDHLRSRIIDALGMKDWCPNGLGVIVRDGIVHLSGIITDERSKPRPSVLGRPDVRVVLHRRGGRGTGESELGNGARRHKPIRRSFPSDTRRVPARTGAARACEPVYSRRKNWCG